MSILMRTFRDIEALAIMAVRDREGNWTTLDRYPVHPTTTDPEAALKEARRHETADAKIAAVYGFKVVETKLGMEEDEFMASASVYADREEFNARWKSVKAVTKEVVRWCYTATVLKPGDKEVSYEPFYTTTAAGNAGERELRKQCKAKGYILVATGEPVKTSALYVMSESSFRQLGRPMRDNFHFADNDGKSKEQ